ncbi:protein-disulfide reductase DsbD [Paucibacter sp. R3-3]|uniref:Thiol:disulfide interchange protein DsbD n=1 Tax=Roseateles agri TaxID=3098619 RepID=A0ABU5DG03_9BURK|nr:protein-disulfide reductase DsbD [Paucibacter sp. R3-3]MDY0745207.1 protein-disulfide reductase DsbD [Paucibacter sp. R3-3]
MSRLLMRALAGLVFLALALGLSPARADDFLDPEQAFALQVHTLDDKTVEAAWAIAPGYYMYREQFKAAIEGATLGEPVLPAGDRKFDETFQKEVEIYHDRLAVRLPVSAANGPFKLTVTGQGCAVKGLCYPPMTTVWQVDLAKGTATKLDTPDPLAAGAAAEPAAQQPAAVPAPASASAGDRIASTLAAGHFWPIVGLFLLLGLGLSLTPCVLPMLPILSSIIVGSGAPSRARGLLLAVGYSLGMAVVYTLLGVAAALAGEGLAGALQKPWVLSLFALALVAFSLSMFGAYELQLPSGLSGGLTQFSQRLPGGQVGGVFLMGGVSALIVSPCVTGPLAGTLVYISQTRDVVLGGSALFALAMGMSVPLLLLGASAGTLLPRAGAWMDGVKHFFGMLLLAVAIYMVQPVLPVAAAQLLWGGLLVAAAAMFGLFEATPAARPLAWLRKSVAVIALVWGGAQLIGAAQGGTDPLKPLGSLALGSPATATTAKAGAAAEVQFQTVRSIAELDAAIAAAGKPVMLDFYADWCVSCKEMDRDTFTDTAVRERLSHALLLRADVTANSPDDRALLKRFKLFGPPGTIFFDAKGQELPDRVIGFQNVEQFGSSLKSVGL